MFVNVVLKQQLYNAFPSGIDQGPVNNDSHL